MEPDLLEALKALSDASRLRIVGLLAGGRGMAVEDLAAALELTPATVVHHLKRLSHAGLVEARRRPPYVEYSLRLERLSQIGAQAGRLSRQAAGEATQDTAQPSWADAKASRVLHSFFDGERMLGIPAQRTRRLIVLRYLAETVFDDDRPYPEKEVNQLLGLRHPDVAALRRYLVDEGFMSREGGIYRLRPREHWPAVGKSV